ncbi:MAG: hypothetical protein JNL38_02720 [Myxococcales bacterium]|nr:hypothetical protein [Myxococcales bacterium]
MHVRVVPEGHLGPGVDLLGDDARAVLAAAAPVASWLTEREPGVRARSVSLVAATGRVLATYVPEGGDRPFVIRVDRPASDELFARAEAAIAEAAPRVRAALARRRA